MSTLPVFRRIPCLITILLTFSHCNLWLDWEDDRPGVCGDGVREAGEACDGTDLGGATCDSLGYTGGEPACRADCTIDPAGCTMCGDGRAEGDEACDIEDLKGVTCQSEGYYGGQAACSETCALVLEDCMTHGRCGDGEIQGQPGEVCDGENLGGSRCSDLRYWDGEPACNDYCNQILVDGCRGVEAISAGAAHTCLTDGGGIPYCWGDNGHRQAGGGANARVTWPVQLDVVSCEAPVRVTAAFDATCGLCDDSFELRCWGDNSAGQLGQGDLEDRPAPTVVPPPADGDWLRVAIGADHLCGIAGVGDVWCAGANASGQLGTGDQVAASVFRAVDGPPDPGFGWIAAGAGFTCAVDGAGAPWCWGRGDRGQIGDGATEDRPRPTEVASPGGVTFLLVTAGDDHVCALDTTGDAWCWGAGDRGQLGDGQLSDAATPAAVHMPPNTDFSDLACAGRSCCGFDPQGRVFCWGANDAAQLGIGAGPDRSEPIQALLPAGTEVMALAVGGAHVCVLTIEGAVWCWGQGGDGQLGQGDVVSRSEPVRVVP
jgi:alpha-tubulin suppressor-like RCC1 family protein